jgi:PKD repeat protein
LYYFQEKILGGLPPNTDYFRPRPVIARFDNNYNLVWKKTLREFYGTDYSLIIGHITEVQIVKDSLFVGAFNYIEEIEENMAYKERLRLSQYNLNGENKWNRDYIYYPTDDFNDPEYGIYDLELTPDGGYIMLGEVQILDSLLTNAPGQFGYVLKTNCLGFLGDPIAEFAYSTNYGDVQFVNSSIQAGSYQWIFGDGDTLSTSEYIDSVKHNYLNNGNYTVQLIAYGCNGINDTFSKTIQVSVLSNGFAGDGTLLTLFPNPISSGESIAFYVGNITQENVTFEIVNALGQIVFQGKIQLPNTTYIIPFNFASGQYFVSLKNNSDLLEVEKLIVR